MSDGLDQPRLGVNEEPEEERREDVWEDPEREDDAPPEPEPSRARATSPSPQRRKFRPKRTSCRVCEDPSTRAATSRSPTATA